MSSDFQVDDIVKVKDQDIKGKIVAIHDAYEIVICEIYGLCLLASEFECPDGHLSYRHYELQENA